MPVLRLLLIVLILLNLLAIAAIQGWLGSAPPRGEPERLTNQINPELIVLRPPELPEPVSRRAAQTQPRPAETAPPARVPERPPREPAPVPAADVQAAKASACVAFSGLTESQARRIEQAGTAVLHVSVTMVDPPSAWWVRIPPLADRQAAEHRVGELRSLGVSDLFIVRDPGPNENAISLGLFRTEASARQHLADLEARRVRGAEIAARSPAVYRIDATGPESALASLSERVASEFPDATRVDCTP